MMLVFYENSGAHYNSDMLQEYMRGGFSFQRWQRVQTSMEGLIECETNWGKKGKESLAVKGLRWHQDRKEKPAFSCRFSMHSSCAPIAQYVSLEGQA